MKFAGGYLTASSLVLMAGIFTRCQGHPPPSSELTASVASFADYRNRFIDSPYFKGQSRPYSGTPSLVGFSHSAEPSQGNLPVDRLVTYKEVDAITREAVQRAGGLKDVIVPGDDWVLIKPNMVEHPPGQGHVGTATDVRVMKSLIQQIMELPENHRPKRVTVGEGGGKWRGNSGFVTKWPQYDNLSYDEVLKDFGRRYPGTKFDWIDFNTESRESPFARDVPVPGGGLEFPAYTIPRAILDADKFLIVSVMKTHEMVRATMTHKNYIGITPSTEYGTFGLGHFGLHHGGATPFDLRIEYDNAIDRTVADLFSYHPADFALVECFRGTEENGPREGWEIRRNLVIAGKDPLAVDAVGAYYMGLNPNDLDYLHWSYARGNGNTFDLNHIDVHGPDGRQPARTAIPGIRSKNRLKDFVKHTLQPYQGRGIRTWLLNGPHAGTDLSKDTDQSTPDGTLRPVAGTQTAGKPWQVFSDYNDYMDIGKFYGNPTSAISLAYSVIHAEKDLATELRFASDNGIRILLNGEEVYSNGRTGTFPKGRGVVWIEDTVRVQLNKGANHLLVKVLNDSGPYGFSMYVSEDDGDTPIGVTFHRTTADGVPPATTPAPDQPPAPGAAPAPEPGPGDQTPVPTLPTGQGSDIRVLVVEQPDGLYTVFAAAPTGLQAMDVCTLTGHCTGGLRPVRSTAQRNFFHIDGNAPKSRGFRITGRGDISGRVFRITDLLSAAGESP